MALKRLFALYAASLGLLFILSGFQASPGYLDADYHLYMGERLATGEGFTEALLWNYLDDPTAIPQPSHAYWPPLPSLLAALGIKLFPALGIFSAARLVFLFLAAAIPPLTALLSFNLTQRQGTASFAGLLALVPIYYFPFLATTDSFAISMLLGFAFFLILSLPENNWRSRAGALGLGLVAGLLHLARAEGLLWLFIALLAYQLPPRRGIAGKLAWLPVLVGYLLVMLPWFLRNQGLFGAPIASGASKVLWLTNYDELFAFPADQLNFAHWLDSGWAAILEARLWALGQNSVSALVVQGQIILAPLAVIAAWRLRSKRIVPLAAIAWAILYLVMSLLFPFPGVRGGFFHAGAVLQPLIWVLAAEGLNRVVGWGADRRGWDLAQAIGVFRAATLLFAAVLTLFVFSQRVLGPDPSAPAWDESYQHYVALDSALEDLGIAEGEVVMVNNPAGFALVSERSAIVVPNGDIQISLAAAQKFGAAYLLLELNHPQGMDGLYQSPESDELVEWVTTVEGSHIFHLQPRGSASP